ncbi:MAG: glycosyltransferase family 9 protein [Pedosphaera sp.]|nr:glycosyltransferase family 9 protein [Pedosphaera sp.]
MRNIDNILFIKFKSMGDVIFTLPAIHLLRQNFPTAKITYLTSSENEPIVAGFPEVDELLVVDRKIFKQGNPLKMGAATVELFRRLRRGHFSLAIDFQCYAETAMMSWLTHSPERWGYQIGRRLRRFAYTHSMPRPGDVHPVDANLTLLTHFGLKPMPVCNQFKPPEKGREAARQFLAQHKLNTDAPTLIIQPFTSSPQKNWPLENYLAVANFCRAKGVQVIFGGGPGEKELLSPVVAAGFPVFAGLPLSTVAWLLERATLVLGGDTGLLHLAVAMGKRVLMLMVPGGPGRCIPYGHPEWVISPTRSTQLSEIQPDAVNEAIATALLSGKENNLLVKND